MKKVSVDKILTWLTLGLFRFVYVKEGTNVIVTKFGKYVKTLKPGLNFFFSGFGLFGQIHYFYVTDPNTMNTIQTHEVDVKEIVFDFPKEKVISKDNVQFKVDGIVFFRVVNPRKAVFNVNDYVKSLQLTISSILRDEIGRFNLEEIYYSRATLSRDLEKEADKQVTEWGIDVTQLELKEFELGDFAQELIEQKQEELKKRKIILKAQGMKEAKIEEAKALRSYAEMEAEAIKIKAKAEAEAEKCKFEAEVYGYEMIANILQSHPEVLNKYLQLHNAEKIAENLGNGRATTVFMPNNMRLLLSGLNIIDEDEGTGEISTFKDNNMKIEDYYDEEDMEDEEIEEIIKEDENQDLKPEE